MSINDPNEFPMRRIIPVLLLGQGGVVKTVRFRNAQYVGDPCNILKIFNEKEVDEIIIVDIEASKRNATPNLDALKQIASECFMPVAFGGGISSIEQIRAIFATGVEKVILNTAFLNTPRIIHEAAETFGSQAIVVSIDVKKNWLGQPCVWSHCKAKVISESPVGMAMRATEYGAGEIFLQSVDRDGTGNGFDLDLIRQVAQQVPIPVVACGGAGNISHLASVLKGGTASAVAAGSMFVYHGKQRAVLISYPNRNDITNCLA